MESLHDLDRVDILILKELAVDGRLSWRDLSEHIGLSGNVKLKVTAARM